MPENLQPENLSTWMRDMERRLAAVERPARQSIVEYVGVYRPGDFVNVTSGTFANEWVFTLSQVVADSVAVGVTVFNPAATTSQVRLRAANVSGSPTTDTVSTTAGVFTYVRFDWLVPDLSLGSTGVEIAVQIRRASGTGTVQIYRPFVAMALPGYAWNASPTGNPNVQVL